MRIVSILSAAVLLFAAPFASHAEQRCEHSAPRDSTVDLSGVLVVDHVGSGSVDHRDVRGKVRIPEDD
jgi:hypothetical protein